MYTGDQFCPKLGLNIPYTVVQNYAHNSFIGPFFSLYHQSWYFTAKLKMVLSHSCVGVIAYCLRKEGHLA